jgi:hypothetical protein
LDLIRMKVLSHKSPAQMGEYLSKVLRQWDRCCQYCRR